MQIIINSFVVILVMIVIGFIINTVFFKSKLRKVAPYGKMVNVKNKKMHLYSMGSGEETIVILPGFGIALPSADFSPLMRSLSKDYTVVTVEYFGTGFSDGIKTPRTNENYTEEIRESLKEAGFNPPYILMPHSAGGIYSEYYASKYPEEITSIIMLDTTSTASTEGTPPAKYVYTIAKLQQDVGLTRFLGKSSIQTRTIENGYTEKEISDYKTFNNYLVNDTMINQSSLLMDNVKEVNTLDFPNNIPVLKVLSKETLTGMGRFSESDGMTYQNLHLDKLGKNAQHKVVNSSHFLYHTHTKEISKLIHNFLNNIKELA